MTVFEPNDGSRPSRFLLDRYATGELDAKEAAELEARLDDDARAYLASLDAARAEVPPLDFAALRARTADPIGEVPQSPKPANQRTWRVFLPLIIAALVILALLPSWRTGDLDPTTEPDPTVRVRGEAALLVFTADGEDFVPYTEGTALGEGDAIGLRIRPAQHERVVIVSLDAHGSAVVLFPESGSEGYAFDGDGRTRSLPGTFTLDDAPGPEVLVAVFDRNVPDALIDIADRFEEDGVAALTAWAEEADHVDVVVVERR